jgi:hypothetical protein
MQAVFANKFPLFALFSQIEKRKPSAIVLFSGICSTFDIRYRIKLLELLNMYAMRSIRYSLLMGALFSALVFMGCPDEPPVLPASGIFELNIRPTVSGQTFEKEIVYENINGRKYYLDRFDMYISDITLIDEQGGEKVISEIELFDLTSPGAGKNTHGEGVYRQYEVESGKYKGIRFSIGVPETMNLADPASYAETHPLSTFNNMHWSWAAGYRFMVVEGRIDSSLTADGTAIARPLVYHTGLGALYRTIEYTSPEHAFTVGGDGELQFVIEMDVNRLFYNATDTLDMVNQNITHTMPMGSEEYKIAETLTNNLVNTALYKVPF